MKKTSKMIMAIVAGVFLMSGTAFAFHAGGVAHCDGCHSMHGGSGNTVADGGYWEASSPQFLLNNTTPTGTCLNCHADTNGDSYHSLSSTAGTRGKSQAGDFWWVTGDASYDYEQWGGGPVVVSEPDNHGHNVVSVEYGINPDGVNTTAPGDGPTATGFSCVSCHDPHGQVNGGTSNGTAAISASGSYGDPNPTDGSILGNFRLLGGDGYNPESYVQVLSNPVPVAETVNGGYGQSYGIQTDYGQGMSDWCAQCHPTFGTAGSDMHPVNATFDSATYNAYVASGDFTGNTTANDPIGGYDALVPFERNVTQAAYDADKTLLNAVSPLDAAAGSEVMCLSCHRAHASAFNNILRWDNTVEFLAESHIFNQFSTSVSTDGAYYRNGANVDIVTDYGHCQRQLCNKCHVKD